MSRKFISITWRILSDVRPRNPLINNFRILTSKFYNLNGLLSTNNIIVTVQPLSHSFFTSQRILLASKKKAGGKSGKKSKNYVQVEDEEVEEVINIKNRDFDFNKVETKVNAVIENLKKEYGSIRIGRANPAILDSVIVPFKGNSAPLKDIAQVIVKDPQTLIVHVHEEELIKAVDKSIRVANLNLNPMIEGKHIKVPIPKITTEYREKMTKFAAKLAESAKIKIRLVRQDGMKDLKHDCKNGLSSDESKKLNKNLESLIEKFVIDVDEILKVKTKEISGV
ncbi:13192_t:CDS:2 [Funneliformis geosporum]|uniref:6561_t:CDS:1 n=1 Tax=Funneliformis geosporum TaxID=1117311 RepID=A0A9W4SX39_9GLOM|nr:13192_t:CDS:2 [Funneliformis geosporum]CAI2184807.1 6561_t:CDS:2 [Funneliformis geosporum]